MLPGNILVANPFLVKMPKAKSPRMVSSIAGKNINGINHACVIQQIEYKDNNPMVTAIPMCIHVYVSYLHLFSLLFLAPNISTEEPL